MAYVYRHVRLDTNSPFYIGVGNDNRDWFTRAKNKTHRNRIWKEIINKTEYRIDILLNDLDYSEAIRKEKEFISFYGRDVLVANLTDGGYGSCGRVVTQEFRDRISQVQKGRKRTPEQLINMSKVSKEYYKIHKKPPVTEETRRKMSAAVTGFKHTQQAKDKISKINKGRVRTEDFKKGVSEFWSGRKKHPGHGANVSKAKTGFKYTETAKQNLRNAWANMDPIKRRERNMKHSKPVNVFNIETNQLIGNFDCLGKAAQFLGDISESALRLRANNKLQKPSKYIVKYV